MLERRKRQGNLETIRLYEINRSAALLFHDFLFLFSLNFLEFFLSHQKQGPGLPAANREELNIVDSVEPDPAGFREQVS